MIVSKLASLLVHKTYAASGALTNPLGEGVGLKEVADKVISAILMLATPIVGIMILIGGFQIMTAQGSQEKVSDGKKTITYAVVGFVIILMAKSAVMILKSIID